MYLSMPQCLKYSKYKNHMNFEQRKSQKCTKFQMLKTSPGGSHDTTSTTTTTTTTTMTTTVIF